MARGEKAPPVYECQPPPWLPKVHTAADLGTFVLSILICCSLYFSLGYVGFFPPRPDQEEEVLTENNVKNGLHQVAYIPVCISKHDLVQIFTI